MKSVKIILSLIVFSFVLGCSQKVEQVTTTTPTFSTKNHFQFVYSVTVPYSDASFTTGEVFVPIPQSNEYQEVHDIAITTNGSYEVLTDPEYNNKYAKIKFSDSLKSDLNLSVVIDISRDVQLDSNDKTPNTIGQPNNLTRFLQADSLVPIDGIVANEATALSVDSMNKLEQAKAFYEHLYETMKYDKSGEGWGRGDALYACDIRKGNCTDFHSLFIGMARSVEIPARFLIGFPLPESKNESVISGYHCWAEFYVDDKGWIPVDISEAVKDSTKKDFLFGNLDNNRMMLSVGRDIKIATANGDKSINFFIYPQVFIDGEPSDNFDKKFEFKQL